MNIAVLNIRDILKMFIKIIIVICLVIIITRFFNLLKNDNTIDKPKMRIINHTFLKCIKSSLSIMGYNNPVYQKKNVSAKTILIAELGMLETSVIEIDNMKIEQNTTQEAISNNVLPENENAIIEVPVDATTEVVKENNITGKYTNIYETVEINNQTDYELTEEIYNTDINILNKKKILIYHTHTCESYTSSDAYSYEMTGNYRTTDLNYTVARVGEELKKMLEAKSFIVNHNKTLHDYPSYSGSYSNSLETVQNILNNDDTQIVFDLHRDAVGSSNEYAPCVKINGESVAQLMFVIGTDGGGLEHPNWKQNLKFAIEIQQRANEMYPGLFRPIILRNFRYNQNVAPGASVIEVGATGNTLEQCILSMAYLANVLEAM